MGVLIVHNKSVTTAKLLEQKQKYQKAIAMLEQKIAEQNALMHSVEDMADEISETIDYSNEEQWPEEKWQEDFAQAQMANMQVPVDRHQALASIAAAWQDSSKGSRRSKTEESLAATAASTPSKNKNVEEALYKLYLAGYYPRNPFFTHMHGGAASAAGGAGAYGGAGADQYGAGAYGGAAVDPYAGADPYGAGAYAAGAVDPFASEGEGDTGSKW